MQCAQCGMENVEGSQVCTNCGVPLATPVQPVYPPQPQPMPQAPVGYAQPPGGYAPVPAPQPQPGYTQSMQPGYPPQQVPPVYPPQQQYAAPPPPLAQPPKKKHGCLITMFVILAVVLLGCAGLAWGITGMFKPKDLGVSYTEADYQSAVTKLGIVVEDKAPNLPVEQTKMVYSGKKKVNLKLTSAEVSAAISMHHRSPRWALSDVQILLGDNNQFQMSGYAAFNGQKYGFNADLTAVLASSQTVGGSAQNIMVFGVDFPKDYYEAATGYLVGKANEWLGGMGEGLDIQTAQIVNGELVLVGTVPARAERVPIDSVVTSTTPTP